MNTTETFKNYYSRILIFFIIIGVIAGSYLVFERHQIEKAQNHIENIVDYDAVLRAASYEKAPQEETIQKLKNVGVTAMAVYDRTLEKAHDAGEIKIIKADNAQTLQILGGAVRPGATYVISIPGKDGYFKEIKEDLIQRLGAGKVIVKNTNQGQALELMQPYTSLMEMKLSISRLQAEEVSKKGFNVIVRPTNFKGITKDDVDFLFRRLDGVPTITGMIFVGKEAVGYPNQLNVTYDYLKERKIPLVGIEAVNQLQYDTQVGVPEMANSMGYSIGRVYTVTKEEMKKLSPDEVTQWFYISDLERNIRYNLFPIYEEGTGNKTALGSTLTYIQGVNEKLADRGFEFGRASIYPTYKPSIVPFMFTLWGAVALFSFVFNLLVLLKYNKQMLLFAALSFITLILYVISNGTVIAQIWALSSAVMAPVGAMILLMNCWKARHKGKEKVSLLYAIIQASIYLIGAALIASIGGIYIASLLGNTRFFMEFALFRGVKLTFILPIILTTIAYLQRFPLWKGNSISSIEDSKLFIKDFLFTDIKMYMLVIAGFLAGVVWIFIGRSGHTAGVPVPGFELALRRFLENTLYARPREKEFLIGHPALMIACVAVLRKWPMVIHFILTIGGVIGISSMVETFCHLRTPVMMSIMRGLDGLIIGLVIGCFSILAIQFMIYVTKWYQGQGAQDE